MREKKILFIHSEKKFKTGAHYINETIIQKLKQHGYGVDSIYPTESIDLLSPEMFGIANILLFYSLIKKHDSAEKYSIVQGTTYTPLAFLGTGVPVISHFGSSSYGFLKSVPSMDRLSREKKELGLILRDLYEKQAIPSLQSSLKPLRDISKIEVYVAKRSDAVIVTSKKVMVELLQNGVPKGKVVLIHNAIEGYWFGSHPARNVKVEAQLVYLGRLGNDHFTVTLKGIPHLIYVFNHFPLLDKVLIGMCHNAEQYQRVFDQVLRMRCHLNVEKKKIPDLLRDHYGDIYVNTSQYEGFCLSLIEAMSQGLVPIMFPVGVVPEIIQNGKNGYVVHNIDEMVSRINLLRSDVTKRREMAQNAMQTARLFNSTDMIRHYIRLYDSLTKKRAASLK